MRVLELDGATTWFAEKDAFVAAEAEVHFDIAFAGLRQGLAGGEGLSLATVRQSQDRGGSRRALLRQRGLAWARPERPPRSHHDRR